jgi:hypothetical protein
VKAPLLPFHGWLRLACTEAPPEVAAILSGVVSKAAVFGLVWIVLPHFPEPVEDFRTLVLVLASATLVYGSVLAFRQPDIRGVIAYSSMGQMGLIVLGIFAANDLGLDGAVLHSVNHGLVSAGFFLLAAMIETRAGTGAFSDLGGMAKGRPFLATLVMILGMFTLAVPGSANFAGEFTILAGVFGRDPRRADGVARGDHRAVVPVRPRRRSSGHRELSACDRHPSVDWLALSPTPRLANARPSWRRGRPACVLGCGLRRGRRLRVARGLGLRPLTEMAAVVVDSMTQIAWGRSRRSSSRSSGSPSCSFNSDGAARVANTPSRGGDRGMVFFVSPRT